MPTSTQRSFWRVSPTSESIKAQRDQYSVRTTCHVLGQPSMMQKRICWDGAVAESLFSSLMQQRIKKQVYKDRELALNDSADRIETFYNRSRSHRHLGGLSHVQFDAVQKPRRQGVR